MYLLAPLAMGVLIFSPLWTQGIPNTADGMLHLFRTALWSDAWSQGDFWPRWHSALYGGLGYPLFNFYAPLLYILGGIFALVMPVTTAFKTVLLLASLAYPVGMYLWVRDSFSRLAAVTAAAAFAFATYRFREIFIQGNYAQFLAWAMFPWVLFFWRRLAESAGRTRFAGAVLSLTALLLLHNISAMLLAPFAALYVLWQATVHRTTRPWARLLLAAICAGLMGMVFWLPALFETEYVRVHVLTQGYFDVAGHFITLAEQLAATPLLDGRSANPSPPFNVGRFVLLPASFGALLILRKGLPHNQRGHLIFVLAAALFAAFMMLAPSLPVWRTVPYIAFAEFPTRLYGVLSLFVALLAGAGIDWLVGQTRMQAMTAILVVFGLIVTTANLQLPRTFLPVRASASGLTAYVADYNAPGTTSAGEYLPVWVQSVPAEPALDEEGVRRALLDPPPGMAGEVVIAGPSWLTLRVASEVAAVAPVSHFFFPGWSATVNGSEVAPEPCGEAGVICVPVPAGESLVELSYTGTPVQSVARWLALAGVLFLLIVLVVGVPGKVTTSLVLPNAARGPALALAALVATITVLKIAWIAPHPSLFRMASPAGVALPAQHHTDSAVGADIRLIGWDIAETEAPQGGEFHVRLYWQADRPVEENFRSFVQIIGGADQREYGASAHLHPGNMPTSSWSEDFYVVDDHTISIADDTPPILYTLRVGLSPPNDEQARIGETDLSPQVRVLAPSPTRIDDDATRVDAVFGDAVLLLGYDSEMGEGALTLTLYWRADVPVPANRQIFVHVLDAEGETVVQSDAAPYGNLYPPDAWREGEVVRDVRTILLPAGSAPERLAVGIYDLQTGVRMPVTGDAANDTGDAALLSLTAVRE